MGDDVECDPWDGLARFISAGVEPHPLLRNFRGGVVGFLSYDLCRSLERIPDTSFDDLHIPDARFDFVDRFIEIDHTTGATHLVALLAPDEDPRSSWMDDVEAIAASCRNDPPQPVRDGQIGSIQWTPSMQAWEFEKIVDRARQYIYDGDIFQVNLSIREQTRFESDPLDLYNHLRQINPSPYMSYMEYDDLAIVSASPELLVKVHDGSIITRPIAGTRPRSLDDDEDQRLVAELVSNEKERAEHLMLVDLERNDIGKVAEYGTVSVDAFMAVERYSHVSHIVSQVSGRLADGITVSDVLRAVFPGGTITGAPKVRSMEIIDELEPTRRGIYTGSIGWIGLDGTCEFNIVIRTVLVKDAQAYVQSGSGIVADSIPALEYAESMRKAEAGMEAVRRALSPEVDQPRPIDGPHTT